ncbi:MAG: NYN domain-containing protein [Heteroscytonema crispum UTEX LB 1556]
MPSDTSLMTIYDSTLLNKVDSYVCQVIIYIQERQPELLLEKYRNVQWRSNQTQSGLIAKLTEVLSQSQDWDDLLQKLHSFLKSLLVTEAFQTPVLMKLIEKICQLNQVKSNLNGSNAHPNFEPHEKLHNSPKSDLNNSNGHQNPPKSDLNNSNGHQNLEQTQKLQNQTKSDLNGSANPKSPKIPEKLTPVDNVANVASLQQTGITVLLLDAENLQINTETEQFLTTVCNFPIQVKIAFANWRSMGKLDVEFHGRGYELIHVPVGKDNADGKMIAVGLSIHERYPKAREVLVCSSDTVMTTLCNHLQQNGLIVYQVSKQGSNITIFNNQNGEKQTHIILPSIEQFINQIKELIKTEQKRTKNCWIKLATLSQMFKDKHQLTITQVVSKHLTGKRARDIFVNYPAEFVVHQTSEQSELYVTLFAMNQVHQADSTNDNVQQTNVASLSGINSKIDLEQALKNIINELTIKSPNSYVDAGILSSKFLQKYDKSITEQIKCLHLSGNFIQFLQSCSSFKLKQTEKRWHVAVR